MYVFLGAIYSQSERLCQGDFLRTSTEEKVFRFRQRASLFLYRDVPMVRGVRDDPVQSAKRVSGPEVAAERPERKLAGIWSSC
jgi:hypothetical protein